MKEDRIISAWIGLVGACNNNPKTDNTDNLVIKSLAFSSLCPEYDDRALRKMVDDICSEKNSVAPGCAVCTAPCGNTSDYDVDETDLLRLLDEAESIEHNIRSGGRQNDQEDYKN